LVRNCPGTDQEKNSLSSRISIIAIEIAVPIVGMVPPALITVRMVRIIPTMPVIPIGIFVVHPDGNPSAWIIGRRDHTTAREQQSHQPQQSNQHFHNRFSFKKLASEQNLRNGVKPELN